MGRYPPCSSIRSGHAWGVLPGLLGPPHPFVWRFSPVSPFSPCLLSCLYDLCGMDVPAASAARLMFEAEVKPHRSLSRRGLWFVIAGMCLASLFVTSLMALLGAWPVIGFNGADLLLALVLIWLNVRAARARETIRLSETELSVLWCDASGRQTLMSLSPAWANVVLEERAGTVPKLLLTSRGTLTTRGTSCEVARQLGETEKRDLAAALGRALYRWRNPRFDNPQLR